MTKREGTLPRPHRRVWLSIGQFMAVICLALSGVAHGASPVEAEA